MDRAELFIKFNKFKNLSLRLDVLKRRLAQIEEQLNIKASQGSEIQSNSMANKQEDFIAEKVDLQRQIEELESVYKYERKELEKIIDRLEDSKLHTLMYYRYIKCLKWSEVAGMIGYATDYTMGKLKNMAINKILEK